MTELIENIEILKQFVDCYEAYEALVEVDEINGDAVFKAVEDALELLCDIKDIIEKWRDKSTDERYNLAEASRIVLNQLLEYNMFKGAYDARNGKPEFIYGIQTVIENIAYNIDEETGDKISDMITRNIVESMNKAEVEK